ncbi:MAG: family 16 glycosylhydrolase [Phycisphaeraceae bacterium]
MDRTIRTTACALLFSVATPALASPPSGYRLLYADEFNGSTLDTLKWDYNYPTHFPLSGQAHNHNAYMVPEHVSVSNGSVHLLATQGTPAEAPNRVQQGGVWRDLDFTSGAINTSETLLFQYGYIEARMKMSDAIGTWPAFWTLQTDGWPPEIDIMEYPISSEDETNRYYRTYHYGEDWRDHRSAGGYWHNHTQSLADDYHTYAVQWTPSQLKFYFDGVQIGGAINNNGGILNYLDGPNYLILNQAVGGWPVYPPSWPTQGATFSIDWVRVWQTAVDRDSQLAATDAHGHTSWGDEAMWSNGVPNQAQHGAHLRDLSQDHVTLDWSNVRTIGQLDLQADTSYTLGDGDESLILAMSTASQWASITAQPGNGTHVLNTRIEAWSNLVIRSTQSNPLTINGAITSLAQPTTGGQLEFAGQGGHIILNGSVHQQRLTRVTDGVTVRASGGLFQSDQLYDDAALEILSGATLELPAPDADSPGPLGYLPSTAERLVIDAGTLRLTGDFASDRGFTIGAGGATIEAANGATVQLAHSANPDQTIASAAGGDLTLGGLGNGVLDKSLNGTGGLIKTGTGIWTITHDANHTGPTTIHSGQLIVEAVITDSTIEVTPDGTLGGSGQVAEANVSGTLSPGSSPGTLSADNVTLHASATLLIELGETNSDLLNVINTLTIEAGAVLEVILEDGFTPEDQTHVVAIAGEILGDFGPTATTAAGRPFYILQHPSQISLRPAASGDTNLDGRVDLVDLSVLAGNFDGPAGWEEGDFNADGVADLIDLSLLAGTFGYALDDLVPAPATLPIMIGLTLIAGRRSG